MKQFRKCLPICVLALASITPAMAQPVSQAAIKTFASSAEVQDLIAKARVDRKGDAPTTVEPLLSFAPYRANLEYRPIAGPAALHEREDEIMYVIEGAGTLTLGGQMINPTQPDPANQSAAAIGGGSDTAIAKGDFILVPHGTPHQVTAVKGGPLVLMTLHVPQ
jgi:mannose-6-phosphate isomerase-like protein (cupin superfamily)